MNTSQQPDSSEGGYGTPTPEQEIPPEDGVSTKGTEMHERQENDEGVATKLPDGSGTNRSDGGSQSGQENCEASFSAG